MASRQSPALRRLTPKKVMNALGIYVEYRRRKTVLRHKPVVLKFEPSTYCNLRCPPCHPDGNSFGGTMSEEVFETLLDKAALDYVIKTTAYMFGEPLWNKRIYDMICELSRRNVTTSISTNFHIFGEEHVDALIESGLTWILVCIDGADQESYEKYRVRGNLQKVLGNLELLIRRKKERRSRNPVIEVQSIVFDHNKDQIEDIRDMCSSIGVERFTTKADVLPQVTGSVSVERPAKRKSTCFFLYGSLMVDYDGVVIPCCLGRYEFGNLMTSSFEEVWNNEKFVAARAWFASGFTKKDERFDLPCYKCPLFM
jgi:MoaA/NifB/PqqE/SkfB family radical SAM enzyme